MKKIKEERRNGMNNAYVSKNTLLRIYRAMCKKPLKIWVLKDFFLSSKGQKSREYFNTLISLKLIEKCSAIYFAGNKYTTKRDVIGYRLLR